ncbi:MAG TPA: cold-shock protein [Burkholderiales bacterium]|nr:cold-shock protein [Burkholderiales bacterium]
MALPQTNTHAGSVRWFSYSKGCGFITPDDGGTDVFAHFSEFKDSNVRSLRRDQRVCFRVSAGPEGRVARNICSLG